MSIAILIRLGSWKLCWTDVERGLYVSRRHKSRGPKRGHVGSGDKSLTGSSLGAWTQWDRVLPPTGKGAV